MASRIPTEVRFMIWSHLLAINLAEEPRIYQLKRTKCEVTGAGQCKITVYGDNISQPVLLSIEREARRIAQPHYVRVSGVICGRRSASETSSSSSRAVAGGFWIRRKDIVYIDAAFSRTLPSIVRTNMAGIERIAVDVQVLDEKRRQHGHSMMDRVLTVFSSVKHVVFLAPTKPNKRGNYYKGLRLVDKEEAEDAKDLPSKLAVHPPRPRHTWLRGQDPQGSLPTPQRPASKGHLFGYFPKAVNQIDGLGPTNAYQK